MTTRTAARAAMLERNAAALEEIQPGLAAGLREIPEDFLDGLVPLPIPAVDESRLGMFAKAAASQASGDCLFLLGLGPPHMVKLLRDALAPDKGLVFVEPTLEVAVRLLCQHDYSEPVSEGLCGIICAGNDFSLQQQIESLVVNWGVTEIQLVANPMRPLGEKVTTMMGNLLRSALHGVELSASTSARYGRDMVSHVTANLRAATAGHDLSPEIGTHTGVPAFLCGAGPSLDGDAALLARMPARGLVIACDAALPVLLSHGVNPDVVVTLDVSAAKAGVFERNYVRDAVLVALLGAHPELIRAWIGPMAFAVDSHPLARWASAYAAPVFDLGSLGNVAQLGYAVARSLGCDPVVLCGVDLAVGEGGAMYAGGVEHDAPRWFTDMPPEHREMAMEVPGNSGDPVKTLRNMAVYAETLAHMAAQGGSTFNTAPHGARIQGVPHAPLLSILNSLPEREIKRPVMGTPPTPGEVNRRRTELSEALGMLEGELRSYAADAAEFAEATDSAAIRLTDGFTGEETVVRELQPQLESFGRHSGAISLIEPLQPAITFEINRLLRKTRAMEDPVQRARSRLLALGGLAASGAQLAEFMADEVGKARVRLAEPPSGRWRAVGK